MIDLTNIKAICQDSRTVTPGSLFVAMKGAKFDGHDLIADAVKAGAVKVVYEHDIPEDVKAMLPEGDMIQVESSRREFALLASEFYGNPSSKLKLVGITGTNGKTTTVTLLYNLFTELGYCCGLLSTIDNRIGDKVFHTKNTTSDPLTINSLMAEMVEEGCEYCFMEVSSVGVHQDRIAGLEFDAAIFSNLTHDHLDYHGTFAEYLRCKKLFFDRLPKTCVAITNIDDRNGEVMLQNTKARKVTYSLETFADHRCRIIEQCFDGMELEIDGVSMWTPLIGRHNAYNILAAYSVAKEISGLSDEEIFVALSKAKGAKGRLDVINLPEERSVVIDYAHTPDALENVLKTLREIAPDRHLVCLFGCGGDRDKTKRPEMGAIAGAMSERVVVTSDNSRSERTGDIIKDILAGMTLAQRAKAICIEDRREAIRTAILTSGPGTTILLAGKGHEPYQILDGVTYDFDEFEIVKEISNALSSL